MKVTVIPIVISALGTIPKWLISGLEGLEIRGKVDTFVTIPPDGPHTSYQIF